MNNTSRPVQVLQYMSVFFAVIFILAAFIIRDAGMLFPGIGFIFVFLTIHAFKTTAPHWIKGALLVPMLVSIYGFIPFVGAAMYTLMIPFEYIAYLVKESNPVFYQQYFDDMGFMVTTMGLLFSLLCWMLLGALLGAIIGKFKNRNRIS